MMNKDTKTLYDFIPNYPKGSTKPFIVKLGSKNTFDKISICEKDIISNLEKIVEDQTQRLEQLPALQEEVRNAKGQANSRQVELDAMTKRAVQQSQDLGALKSKVETFQKENYT